MVKRMGRVIITGVEKTHCPFVNGQCREDCKFYNEDYAENCMIVEFMS